MHKRACYGLNACLQCMHSCVHVGRYVHGGRHRWMHGWLQCMRVMYARWRACVEAMRVYMLRVHVCIPGCTYVLVVLYRVVSYSVLLCRIVLHAFMHHVCVHECMYVRVCMFARVHVCMHACVRVCMYVCTQARIHACNGCMGAWLHACM